MIYADRISSLLDLFSSIKHDVAKGLSIDVELQQEADVFIFFPFIILMTPECFVDVFNFDLT